MSSGPSLTPAQSEALQARFALRVTAYCRPCGVALALSTSGNSPNVLLAVAEARRLGLHTIGLTGRGGGKLAGQVDVALVVPSDATERIQEGHITLIHLICELVERTLFPDALPA